MVIFSSVQNVICSFFFFFKPSARFAVLYHGFSPLLLPLCLSKGKRYALLVLWRKETALCSPSTRRRRRAVHAGVVNSFGRGNGFRQSRKRTTGKEMSAIRPGFTSLTQSVFGAHPALHPWRAAHLTAIRSHRCPRSLPPLSTWVGTISLNWCGRFHIIDTHL